ncbi:MAG: MarR family transcriptional regulator [Actinomycetota bacterium]|nr:MarR family transcriptional regulator [Actinomycetota bacterium]
MDRPSNLLGALALAVVDRTTEAVAGAAGHSLSAAAALSALQHIVEAPSIVRLSQILGLTHSGTVRLVDRLEQEGSVRRQRGVDGRSAAVSLTSAGREAAARLTRARGEVLETVLAPLAPEEREVLGDLVGRLLVGMMRDPGAIRWTCRLCDTGACGRYTGGCPIGRAAQARFSSSGPG